MVGAMRDLKTLWGKLIAVIYILSFVFWLIAIIITVIGMSQWGFVREAYGPSSWIFSTFGLFLGAVLIGLWSAGVSFGFLILTMTLLRRVENGTFAANLAYFLGWAFIEAHGLRIFATSFLDMYNDLFLLYLIFYGRMVNPPLTPASITSSTDPIFPIVFILSFSVRTVRYLKQRDSKGRPNLLFSQKSYKKKRGCLVERFMPQLRDVLSISRIEFACLSC